MLILPRANGTIPSSLYLCCTLSYHDSPRQCQAGYCAVGQPRDFLSKSLTLTPYLLLSPFPFENLRSPDLQLFHLVNKTVLSAYWCGCTLFYAWGSNWLSAFRILHPGLC